jgi:hypothetical protein
MPYGLARLDRLASAAPLDRDQLRDLTEKYSVDLATMLFARSILAQPLNDNLQKLFVAELARLEQNPTGIHAVPPVAPPNSPLVMFVPGFVYRSHPENGADFAKPRRHLENLGIRHQFLETNESGSVEANAAQLATALRSAGDEHIVLVSASKAGAEVALALGQLLSAEESLKIDAWINIGGLLGGTPLADQAFHPLRRWIVGLALWWKGWGSEGLRSLRTSESSRRLASLEISSRIPIINLVAATLSGDPSKLGQDGYRKLRHEGPNDGLALLADQILPETYTLLRFGDDHFFGRHDPRSLTLALLRVAQTLARREAS